MIFRLISYFKPVEKERKNQQNKEGERNRTNKPISDMRRGFIM
jgi:hypothetical protein